jgi:hypothetical protein
VAVHERSVWDRSATRKLYDLLAGWRPPRHSAQSDRQTTVTAALDELHPQARVVSYRRPRVIDIRSRVA